MGDLPHPFDLLVFSCHSSGDGGSGPQQTGGYTMVTRRASDAIELFRKSYLTGRLKFVDCDLASLPESTKQYVSVMLVGNDITFEVCTLRYNNTFLFRVDHESIGFLQHDPVVHIHQWVNKDFTDTIDPAAAFGLLFR